MIAGLTLLPGSGPVMTHARTLDQTHFSQADASQLGVILTMASGLEAELVGASCPDCATSCGEG